jgi:hypothetical protein
VAGERPQRPEATESNYAYQFEQRPKESDKAFAAFSVYLSMAAMKLSIPKKFARFFPPSKQSRFHAISF